MNTKQHNSDRSTKSYATSKPSLLNRNIFAFAITLISIVFASTVLYFESQLRKEVESDVYQSLGRMSEYGEDLLSEQLDRHRRNLLFLYGTPPVPGLPRAYANGGVDPLDGTRAEQWKQRLETIFISMLQNNPEIDQLRIISADLNGMELVRVDRLTGRISAIADAELQEKGDTDYFNEAMNLAPNETYISPISLNQEFGEIEFPYRPTIRFLVPIFYESGERFGFLIMNVQASIMIQALRDSIGGEFNVILTDSEGYFIEHPQEDYRFSRDLNPELNWSSSYRVTQDSQASRGVATNLTTNTSNYYSEAKMIYASGESNYDSVIVTTPEEYGAALMQQRRLSLYGFMTFVYIILIGMLIFLKRSFLNSMKLAETRAEHEAIVNNSFDAIVGLDLNAVITSWNRAASELFHRSATEAIGKTLRSLQLFEKLKLEDEIEKLAESETIVSLEYQFKDHDNEEKSLSLTLSRIELYDLSLSGVALIVRDITLQKRAEASIKQINVELEAQVAERTNELNIAHQKAVKSSAFKSAFISSVSHEMRTPLNGMIGTLNLVKRSPLNAEQEKYITMAETSTRTLSNLINDILDLSKIEAGKLDFETKAFNPRQVIELTASSSSLVAHSKGLEFILDTSDVVHSKVIGDSNRLKQILHNLIGNAVKFTDSGEIILSARTRLTDDNRVELSVDITDSGIGIEKANQSKLFHAFTQADKNISGRFGGTGLGLSICKQLCKLMGGDISLSSEIDKGSTFSFKVYFDAKGSETEQASTILKNKHISVAVNNPHLFSALQKLLVKYGGNTEEQWQPAQRYNDGILNKKETDYIFTDFSGSTFKALKDQLTNSGKPTRIIRLYTSTQSSVIESGEESISLPVLHDDVLRTIDTEHSVLAKRPSSSSPDLSSFEKLRNAVVLVVDDNDINLEVACGLLQPLEVQFKTASNGQQALDVLAKAQLDGEKIHCLLMDCQMPVMSGYDCTRHIRNGDVGESFRSIPIIAMTANAMSGEREACLDAGMSDYITKPLSYKHLLEKVSRWVKVTQHNSPSEQSGEQDSDAYAEGLKTWDRAAAVSRMLNNEVLVNRISRMYLDTVADKFAQLELGVKAMDFEAIKSDSHRLKGLSGDIGASRIHHYFSLLEIAAERSEEGEIKSLFGDAQKELQLVTREVKDFLLGVEDPPT